MSSFRHDWELCYPGYHPVGYRLRISGATHWLRFHSLPRSKRHADTDAEWAELLYRQERLGEEIFGFGSPCWMAQTCWETPEGFVDGDYVVDKHGGGE